MRRGSKQHALALLALTCTSLGALPAANAEPYKWISCQADVDFSYCEKEKREPCEGEKRSGLVPIGLDERGGDALVPNNLFHYGPGSGLTPFYPKVVDVAGAHYISLAQTLNEIRSWEPRGKGEKILGGRLAKGLTFSHQSITAHGDLMVDDGKFVSRYNFFLSIERSGNMIFDHGESLTNVRNDGSVATDWVVEIVVKGRDCRPTKAPKQTPNRF